MLQQKLNLENFENYNIDINLYLAIKLADNSELFEKLVELLNDLVCLWVSCDMTYRIKLDNDQIVEVDIYIEDKEIKLS